MEIEQVVEEFLKVLSEGKVEQAEELIMKESQGSEDELATRLYEVGVEIGKRGNDLMALHCFQAAGRIVKSMNKKESIMRDLSAAHNNCANLLSRMKRYEESECHYKEALRINPEYATAHYNYGLLLFNMKRYEESEYHYKEALRMNSKDAEVHNNYGLLLFNMKRYEESECHYKEALRMNSKDAEVHNNYGALLFNMKRYEESECHYKEALRINPEYATAHYNYGALLSGMKKNEESEYHYKEALRINPEIAEAHYNCANLLFNMKRYEESEYHYKGALRIDPEYAEAYGNLGILYSEQKRYSDALNFFEKASNIFEKKKMLIDYNKTEGLKFSTRARLLWREESWVDIRKSLEKAITNFKTCGMEDSVNISNSILLLVTIDQSFNESLKSKTLLDLRERIGEIYNAIMQFKKDLEKSEIYEHKIFTAKFTCMEILFKALNFEPYNIRDLDEARKTLRDETFKEAEKSLNLLNNFIIDLSEFQDLGLERIPKEKEEKLLKSLDPIRYFDGYITSEALQEIPHPEQETWRKPQTLIQYIDFKVPAKPWVNVGIVQFPFNLIPHDDDPVFPPTPENPEILKEKFLKYLERAQQESLDIVCFPEFSMTPEILKIINQKKIKDLIIIGGSYYENGKNTCPLIFNDEIRYIHKIHPSKYGESSSIHGKGMIPGDRLYVFDTHAGRIVVTICEDFRVELSTILSQVENPDFIITISYNPAPERFHEMADHIPPNYRMYILQCNVSEMNGQFGKSCIFGMIEEMSSKELMKNGLKPDDKFRNKVTEIEGEGMIIAEFNLRQKTIEKVTSVDYQTIRKVRHVRLT